MNELVGGTKKTKNRNFLFFAAAISAILVIAVFLFIVLKYTEEKKETYREPLVSKEKTIEEITQSFSASPKSGEKPISISNEVLESFSAIPADSSASSAKNKTERSTSTAAPTVAPIPEDILKSFSAQSVKK